MAAKGVRGRAVLSLALGLLVALAGCSPAATPATASPAVAERGARLYATHCQTCHGDAVGGRMEDYPPRHNAQGHTWHHPDCQLTQIVMEGAGEMGEMMRQMMRVPEDVARMPAFKGTLTEDDAKAVLAYIKTWWTDRQRAWQADVTRRAC